MKQTVALLAAATAVAFLAEAATAQTITAQRRRVKVDTMARDDIFDEDDVFDSDRRATRAAGQFDANVSARSSTITGFTDADASQSSFIDSLFGSFQN